MTGQALLIPTRPSTDKIIGRLIEVSNKEVMNLEASFMWQIGVDLTRRPKPEKSSWIYGTRFWDPMTPENKHEMLWREFARDVSMFIWLEQRLPPLYVGYINNYRNEIPPHIYEYLMVFSREEIVHTLAFRRFMKCAKLDLFSPPEGYGLLFNLLPTMHPVVGILYTLIIEWLAELGAMHIAQDETIDPLTRQLIIVHHHDEVRHITFGRKIVEDFFETAPADSLDTIRSRVGSQLPNLFDQYTYNAEIGEHLSFSYPVAADDAEAHAEIRTSSNNRRLNNERFGELYSWLRKLRILPSP
jgi:P-aminobenzoate N-oxygenase AurF